MEYDIYINDTIGWPISAQYVKNLLQNFIGKPCSVYISSYGGSVADALQIQQMFIDHGDITAYVYGFTASAATIIAMGASKIVMGQYALMLIHRCSNWVDTWGQMNAEEIEETIKSLQHTSEDLKTIDHVIASVYAERTGKDINDIAKMMQEAKWLPANECLEIGLIDEISQNDIQPEGITNTLKSRIVAYGLPVPEIEHKVSSQESAGKLIEKIRNLFRKENDKPEENTNITNNTSKMKKFFKKISDFLNCAVGTDDAGNATLDEAQLTAIEDALAEKETLQATVDNLTSENTQLTSTVETLQEQVENLLKNDGEETTEIKEEEHEVKDDVSNAAANAKKDYELIKNIL